MNSVTTTFAYRGDGLRDSRTTGMSTTTFTWDINAGLPVVLDDGAQYVYGAGLEAMLTGTGTYYHLADGLGSTMAMIDSTGAVQKSYTYDVYGKPTATGALPNEFDFAGQQTDASTGLQYLRARYMDPETGTFVSRDLLEDKGGTGAPGYPYAAGEPVGRTDPSGLAPWDSPEARWCAARPWWWSRCAAAAGLATFADVVTDIAFGGESDRSDAFRHCVWSACLTVDMGPRSAKTLTDLHERFDTSGDRQEQRKDLWNNRKGREIGMRYFGLGEYGMAAAIRDCASELRSGLIVDKETAPYFPGEENILPSVGLGAW